MIKDEQFTEAHQQWDLKTLYADLAYAKGKPLTPMEKLHLRALLSGHSPTEIAEKLGKDRNGVKTDLCASVYKYIKILLDKSEERIDNYRSISEWLEGAGYKCALSSQSSIGELLAEKSVVNITNVSCENKSIVINFSLKIPTDQSEIIE